jgi:hypothetical protein
VAARCDRRNANHACSITALLFLETHDLSEATEVTVSRQALHYGAGVEVHPGRSRC